MVLLDQSGSMAYCGSRSNNTSKHEFARRLVACLTTLLISQQDAVGLTTFDTEIREVVPARSKVSHLLAIFEALVKSKPGAETALSVTLQQVAEKLKRRGLLILVSDCFDDVNALMKALAYFKHSGSEVVIFQIWDKDELDFPFRQRTQFRSLEAPSNLRLVDPNAIRVAYLKRVEEFQHQMLARSTRERFDLITCTTDQSYAEILSAYIARRESVRRGGAR